MTPNYTEVSRIVDDIWAFFSAQDWDGLDLYIRAFDFETHPPLYGLAVLRTSYPGRAKLPSWNMVVENAKLIYRDLDLLRGLI